MVTSSDNFWNDADEDDLAGILVRANRLGLDVDRMEELYRQRHGRQSSKTWEGLEGFASKRPDHRYGQGRTDKIDSSGANRLRPFEWGMPNRFLDMPSEEIAAEIHEAAHKIRRARTDRGRTKAHQKFWRLLNELWGPVDDSSVVVRETPDGGTVTSGIQWDSGLGFLRRAAAYHLVENQGWTTVDDKGKPVTRLRPVKHHASEDVRIRVLWLYVVGRTRRLSDRKACQMIRSTTGVPRTNTRRWVDHFANEQPHDLLLREKPMSAMPTMAQSHADLEERVSELERWVGLPVGGRKAVEATVDRWIAESLSEHTHESEDS
jgi:hypothetical protein